VWRQTDGGFQRVPWPAGKAPVLSTCCRSAEGRADFADALRQLGCRCFVGATAGMRHALEVGDASEADLASLRDLLPEGCELLVLSPFEEARYELGALRRHCEASDGMLSMGGKSMQIACGDAVYSLPFAMHLGYEILHEDCLSWSDRLAQCASKYHQLVALEVDKQSFSLDGTFVGVTDTVHVASELGLLNRLLSKEDLLSVLSSRAKELANFDSKQQGDRRLLVHAARVLLLRAVIADLFSKACFIFRGDFEVSWTAGFFLVH